MSLPKRRKPRRDSGPRRREPRSFAGTERYRPAALLGQGGMGVVYRAFDAEMGRDVALKTLPELSPNEVVTLKEEFRALAGVTHPNLIELYELTADGHEAFFTMELLDGTNVVEHVRGAPPEGDGGAPPPAAGWLGRLLPALAQLVSAISALHRAGELHCDIKPSNVWVTTSGRLVLLDFGLAVALTGARLTLPQSGGGGTFEFMAPEQIWRAPLSPATDWYAAGEVLYEALTGVPAFRGSVPEIVDAKSGRRIPRPSERATGVPPALDDLAMNLLIADPGERATGDDIARTLRELGLDVADPGGSAISARNAFVGREPELEALRDTFRRHRRDGATLVRVEGPSGIGKSELLWHFTAEIGSSHDALVLRGRCHPQESVPYKAFDALVDALCRTLAAWPESRVAAVVPRNAGALLRIFPAFAGIDVIARAPKGDEAVEPQLTRRRGFEGFGQLLSALATERPIVLSIDDLQWADADSILLLHELLIGIRAAVFVVVAYRTEPSSQSSILAEIGRTAAALPPGAEHTVRLAPLGDAEARALAASTLGLDPLADDSVVATVAAEALGSPFFVVELARHVARGRSGETEGLPAPGERLANVLQDRLRRLGPEELHLLEIVSTAGGPLSRSLVLAAAGLGEAGRPHVARMGRACFLRIADLGDRPSVEVYHDRIRETLLGELPAERHRALHLELASALRAAPDPDPEALFRHYFGAGAHRDAAHFVVPAANRAAMALAFDRAAELYRQALDLGADALPRHVLYERRAEALAAAGRGFEAAESFRAAAESQETGTDEATILDLRRKAAEQFLRSGHHDEGLQMMRAVLARVGLRMPETRSQAARAVLFGRTRLLFRGLHFELRDARDVTPAAVARLDALWTASTSMSMMNHTLADALGVQHLLEALDLGETSRVSRALGYEASFEAAIGGRLFGPRSERILKTVVELARSTGSPYDLAWSHMATGTSAWLRASWAAAVRNCDEANRIYQERCRSVSWELAITNLYALSALSQLGHMKVLGERLPAALKDACDRDDLFAANNYRLGQMSIVWLAQDRVEECLSLAREAEASWRATNYHTQRYHHLVGTTQAALYAGDPWTAFKRIEVEWPLLRAAQFLFLECPRIELRHLRGRAALSAAAASPPDGAPHGASPADRRWNRRALVRLALREADLIRRERLPIAGPFSALLRAGAARLDGNDEQAVAALGEAVRGFDHAGMEMYREAARWQYGALIGGDGGAALVSASRQWMAREGIKKPDAMMAVLAPACGSPAP